MLDVGCGTGALLHHAREAGHTGRLCGLDPAAAMLEVARARTDVEWVLGDLGSVGWERAFDLVVMTGHAFQVFVTDDDLRRSLVAIRSALREDGRFAFETRNPLVREWERWIPSNATEVVSSSGEIVRMAQHVERVVGELITFTLTFTSPAWQGPEVSHSTLRFLDERSLGRFLSDAGFVVDEQFGDWDRTAFTDASPEIITIARPV